MTASSTSFRAARDALARHDWQAAHDAATAAEVPDSDARARAEQLAVIADAAWWLGRLDECIEARERAYALYDELGEHRQAGRCAVWLYENYGFKCRPAIGGAWLSRARRALEGDPECVEHGTLLLREIEVAHGRGDLERASTAAREVVDLGRRLRSTDIEAEALQALGRLQIDQGATDEGLANLDAAMLYAVEGRLSPYSAGKVYCSLISACKDLGDLARVTEWTEATSRWAQAHPFAIFPGICRVHRATALGWQGELAAAEREATQACTELLGTHLPNAAAALAEIGEIRRRLGDLGGAEEAFTRAEEICGLPCSGLALLRLAQGRVEEAAAVIAGALDRESRNRLARGRLLPIQTQIAIAAGDLDSAASAVEELESLAGDIGTTMLHASALSARARLHLAQHEAAAARATVHHALARWLELDMPYEVATARTILGQAEREAGNETAAKSSFAAAEALFADLGASPGARPEDTAGGSTSPSGLTDREMEVLRLVADGRSNREIAADLYVSAKTVSRHLSNIFAKIGVSSRAAATAFAFQNGIVARSP